MIKCMYGENYQHDFDISDTLCSKSKVALNFYTEWPEIEFCTLNILVCILFQLL